MSAEQPKAGDTAMPRFPIPEGFRLLQVGEILLETDLAIPKDGSRPKGFETCVFGIPVAEKFIHWYFRPIPAPTVNESMTVSPQAPEGWYCPNCKTNLSPIEVTYGERHDPRYGGCGEYVGESITPQVPAPASKAMTQPPLDQIRSCNLKDAEGHPLENNVGFLALVAAAGLSKPVAKHHPDCTSLRGAPDCNCGRLPEIPSDIATLRAERNNFGLELFKLRESFATLTAERGVLVDAITEARGILSRIGQGAGSMDPVAGIMELRAVLGSPVLSKVVTK